jgi:hypothetical protein
LLGYLILPIGTQNENLGDWDLRCSSILLLRQAAGA